MASRASSVSRATGGRPISPLLTDATIRKISAKIASGVPMKAAAGTLGIPYRTFQGWLENGRREDAVEPYASLAQAVEFAVDRYHASRVVQLHRVGRDDPKVIMWELERRFRDDWADPDRGINVQVTIEAERRDLAERMLAAAARVMGDDPEMLARFAAEVTGIHTVIEGSAIELPEIGA